MEDSSIRSSNSLSDKKESKGGKFIVYILRTSSNTFYTGQTNNLNKRMSEHKAHKTRSAKYIKYFSSFELVYTEVFSTRQQAMKREWQIKKWPKAKKEALISGSLSGI